MIMNWIVAEVPSANSAKQECLLLCKSPFFSQQPHQCFPEFCVLGQISGAISFQTCSSKWPECYWRCNLPQHRCRLAVSLNSKEYFPFFLKGLAEDPSLQGRQQTSSSQLNRFGLHSHIIGFFPLRFYLFHFWIPLYLCAYLMRGVVSRQCSL